MITGLFYTRKRIRCLQNCHFCHSCFKLCNLFRREPSGSLSISAPFLSSSLFDAHDCHFSFTILCDLSNCKFVYPQLDFDTSIERHNQFGRSHMCSLKRRLPKDAKAGFNLIILQMQILSRSHIDLRAQ